jgi:hypothetical protein
MGSMWSWGALRLVSSPQRPLEVACVLGAAGV